MLAYAYAARHALDRQATFRLQLDAEPLPVQLADRVLLGNLSQLRVRPRQPWTSLGNGQFQVAVVRFKPFLRWLRNGSRGHRMPFEWHQARQVLIESDRPLPLGSMETGSAARTPWPLRSFPPVVAGPRGNRGRCRPTSSAPASRVARDARELLRRPVRHS
jgi:hypothetical protein